MDCYAVIDTNVIVAAVLAKNQDAATAGVLRAVFDGRITPLYHADILDEYEEVLRRDKFHLQEEAIQKILLAIKQYGLEVCPQSIHEILADPDDQIFYEVVMERRSDSAYLVTGNQKHFPDRDFIVTPAQMMQILDGQAPG